MPGLVTWKIRPSNWLVLIPLCLATALTITLLDIKAIFYSLKKKYEETTSLASEFIRMYPDSILPYYQRGVTYYNNKKFILAEADFNTAIEKDSDYIYAYKMRAKLYKKVGKKRKAKKDLKMVKKLEEKLH
ncbi:MAG: hypothetical protein GF401_18225 [Chitinivibrionales bacterium]|nr:hypothetical protein [Chitinivibrionales bacterium]